MLLPAGTHLGPYEILAPLGSGGMGEVYRARDPRTGRDVAIKVAAEKFNERFSREVHAVAALNHPNVCHLYDVGPNYLVMELVEGPTLADRIKQGAVPLDEALFIAKQIAGALEAAHDKGIVHRDLKPANVKLTSDGVVKVLDFGLAKHSRDGEASNPDNSPTLTLDAATRAGTILGTAAYMSPEQARGKNVDKRADIWAFGVVLYELVTGERLFRGADVSEILAGVIKEEPNLDKVPHKVRRLIAKCLAKDPKQRLRDIGDAWDLLDESPAQPGRSNRAAIVGFGVATPLLLALGVIAYLHFRGDPPEPTIRLKVEIPENGTNPEFAISPDGRTLAITVSVNANRQLFLRRLDAAQSQLMPGSEGARYPFWSPDGRYVAFYSQGKLRKVVASGGPPQILCDAPDGRGGTWNRDGVILYSTDDGGGFAIRRVAATGGASAVAAKAPRGLSRYPVFLPDGRHFLYVVTRASAEENGVYFTSLDGKDNRRILPDETTAIFASGHLLFVRENTLMAQTFEPEHGQLSGDPVPIASNVSLTSNVIYAPLTASATGVLVYETGGTVLGNNQLTWYDRAGKILGTVGPPSPVYEPAISPDLKSVAFMRLSAAGSDLWLWDSSRATEQRLNRDPAFGEVPLWSPAGDRIFFVSNRINGIVNFFQKALNGTSQDEVFFTNEARKFLTQVSRDGRFLVFTQLDPKTREDIWFVPLENGKAGRPVAFLHSEANEMYGQLSPDGRWMAYRSDESGRAEIYTRSFPSGEDPTKISIDGGDQPRWRGDGKELFFIGAEGRLIAVPIEMAGSAKPSLSPGAPHPLFTAPPLVHYNVEAFDYDVTPDGNRFLLAGAVRATSSSLPLDVVLNWDAAFKK